MAQAGFVVERLSERWPECSFTIRTVKTSGDRFGQAAIPSIGTGVFTMEIERGLLNRTLDVAVHSLKDLPTLQPEGLAVAAVLKREDPRDALVSRSGTGLAELPEGARIGTGSIRRAAQLLAYRGDFEVVSMRGNVPTRLQKLETMSLDAIILALAGLRRLGREDAVTEILEPDVMLPAAGQGIIAIEARVRDSDVIDIVRALEDDAARVEALAERQLLELLGGGCHAPIGALAEAGDGKLKLRAVVASPDGAQKLRAEAEGDAKDWRDTTWRVAQELRGAGATDILARARRGGS
jgi:hydroxymethylbilane synthase